MENKEDSIQTNLANVNMELLQMLYKYCKEHANNEDNIYVIEFLSSLQSQLMKLRNSMTKAQKKEWGVIDTRQKVFIYRGF